MINKTKSNLDGFLDAYKARNLAANKVTTDFHIEEIIRLISLLGTQGISNQSEIDNGKNALIANKEIDNYEAYYANIIKFGESYKTFLSFLTDVKKEDPSYLTMKKIIYHYLNLAKTLEGDKKIEEIAGEIADLFKNIK